MAEAFIHLGLEDAELIEFCLFGVTQPAITGGTMLESEPEVRIFLDHLGIITDGSPQVTRLLKQQGTVEECHQVVRFEFQHEVEVFDTPVVVAHLGTQQSSVIMT